MGLSPVPLRTPLLIRHLLHSRWIDWLNELRTTLNALPAKVFVKASTSAGQSVVSGNTIIFGTEISDDDGDYNNTTGIFTAPRDGIYSVKAVTRTQNVTPGAVAQFYGLRIAINSSGGEYGPLFPALQTGTSAPYTAIFSSTYELSENDTVEMLFSETLPSVSLDTNADSNYLVIESVD